jgi:hypothetical protein
LHQATALYNLADTLGQNRRTVTHSKQPDDLIAVRTYGYRHEAEVARSILTANAVDALVNADDLGGLQPMLGAANGGVKLLVRRRDEHKARRLLSVTSASRRDSA